MTSEEPLFDPSLKKKKKKQVVTFFEDPLGADADPTTPAPPIEDDSAPQTVHEQMKQNELANGEDGEKENGDEDFKAMFGDLKRKKKKKKVPLDLGEDSGASTPVAKEAEDGAIASGAPAEDLDFNDLKIKKKSTKKKAQLDLEAFERELGEATGDAVDGTHLDQIDENELGEDVFARDGVVGGTQVDAEPWLGSDRDYTYQELLHRFYNQLHAQNPLLLTSTGKRYTLAPPSIHREGNKKTIFANITDIAKKMHRPVEHVMQFMLAEMGTTGSVDGSLRLVIKGRFQQKQVENVLRRYIVEYVTCKTCKSPDTILQKENRIFFVLCESCGSRRSVSTIKTGFQAQVGRRRKAAT